MSTATAERARSALALAGLGAVPVRRADQRRKLDGERVLREAIMLRKRGLTWKEISPHVGASPSWLSFYAPPEERYLTNNELADRRAAFAWTQANSAHQRLESLVALRRKVDIEGERRRREAAALRNATELVGASRLIERRARTRLCSEWEAALREARAQERAALRTARAAAREHEREAHAQERARKRIRRYAQAWETYRPNEPRMVRLDAVVEGKRVATSRHEMHAALVDPFDPQRHLEGELLDSLVGDLSIADIQGMSDEQLRPLRAKLIEAGFAQGGNVQRSERERLRMPMPRRGEGGGRKTFEAMTTDYKHRKPGHRASAGGVHNGRKPRRPGRGRQREKVVY